MTEHATSSTSRLHYRFPGLFRALATVRWKLGLEWMPIHIYEKRLEACEPLWIPGRYEQKEDGKQEWVRGKWDDSEMANLLRRKDVPVSWGPDRVIRKSIWRTAFSPASGLEMKPGDDKEIPVVVSDGPIKFEKADDK